MNVIGHGHMSFIISRIFAFLGLLDEQDTGFKNEQYLFLCKQTNVTMKYGRYRIDPEENIIHLSDQLFH